MKDWEFKQRTEERAALSRLLTRTDLNDQERASLRAILSRIEWEIQHAGDDPANQGISPDIR